MRPMWPMWSIHAFSLDGTPELLTAVPVERPLFQGAGWRVGIELSVVTVISAARPLPPSTPDRPRPAMACPKRTRRAERGAQPGFDLERVVNHISGHPRPAPSEIVPLAPRLAISAPRSRGQATNIRTSRASRFSFAITAIPISMTG